MIMKIIIIAPFKNGDGKLFKDEYCYVYYKKKLTLSEYLKIN